MPPKSVSVAHTPERNPPARNVRLYLRPVRGAAGGGMRADAGEHDGAREPPLMSRRLWKEMPLWIRLHPERGRLKKCWNGCRLIDDRHDGRRYGVCQNRGCGTQPRAGDPILGCRVCRWSVCATCADRPRMPSLCDDPLFHGPDDPCLLLQEGLLPLAVRDACLCARPPPRWATAIFAAIPRRRPRSAAEPPAPPPPLAATASAALASLLTAPAPTPPNLRALRARG